ncbi:hypothetical protein AB0H57_20175 [Micromonospora sp. NPDC050686]|uniref:hypothetical protein n=1 Tax=Micromonospora sp. NPDC050686 TaxID=3154631 RepID=UPI0034045B2A
MSSIRASDAATVWRGLVRNFALMIGLCWAVTALIVAIVVTATALSGDVTESLWLNTGSTQPRYFLLAIGVMLVALHLPVYVAHGTTRRLFVLVGAAFALAISAAFAVGIMIGFGLERTVFGWLGVLDQLIDPYPVQSLGDGLRGILSLTLLSLVYLCCGWLIGSIYYRYGAWTGTLMIPVAALPLFVTEAGLGQKYLGEWLAQEVGLSGLSYRAGLIVALGSAAVVLAVIYGINRAVPIRPRKI